MTDYIRFVSPIDPDLFISGVPAQFNNYIFDIRADDLRRLAKMRVLGSPYGIKELGLTDEADGDEGVLSRSDIAADISDPGSEIGAAVGSRVGDVDLSGLTGRISTLEEDVSDLKNSTAGGGIIIGNEVPSNLPTGAFAVRLRSY